ncbi:MAG: hypothetical protein HOK35_17070 [Cytophagia bacterium]|jgi:phage anti-repressor protein|nr:hypothetical protein [Cytophagia bacterium]
MKNNITIFVIGDGVNYVGTKDIHNHLEVKTEFFTWMTENIKDLQLKLHTDYWNFVDDNGKIYYQGVTLDVAIKISMIEDSFKAKEATWYFIECKKLISDLENSVYPNNLQIYNSTAIYFTDQFREMHDIKLNKLNYYDTDRKYLTNELLDKLREKLHTRRSDFDKIRGEVDRIGTILKSKNLTYKKRHTMCTKAIEQIDKIYDAHDYFHI